MTTLVALVLVAVVLAALLYGAVQAAGVWRERRRPSPAGVMQFPAGLVPVREATWTPTYEAPGYVGRDPWAGTSSARQVQRQPVSFRVGVRSERGRRPGDNQDAAVAGPDVLALADGGEGAPGGEVAARTAVRVLGQSGGEAVLEHAVVRAHQEVLTTAENRGLTGMACTLEAAVVRPGEFGPVAYGVHIGGSAAWLVGAGGQVRRLTTPHADATGRLLRMVGRGKAAPDVWSVPVEPGDRIVLASDGLWSGRSQEAVEKLLADLRTMHPQTQADLLVEGALREGSLDNVSVVVGEVPQPH